MYKYLLLLPILGVVSYYLFFPICTTNSVVRNEYVIDIPYREVLHILARQDAIEEIVSMSEGRILEKNWDSLSLDIDRFIKPNWRVSGRARFVVEVENPNMGLLRLEFRQSIKASRNRMEVITELMRPHKGIVVHKSMLLVESLGNQTIFRTINQIVVDYRVPRKWHDEVHNRVEESNQLVSRNSEICIRELLQRRGVISIPLKKL